MDAVLTSQPEPEGRLHGVVPTHVLIYITCSHRKGLTKAIGGAQPKSVQQRPALAADAAADAAADLSSSARRCEGRLRRRLEELPLELGHVLQQTRRSCIALPCALRGTRRKRAHGVCAQKDSAK